MDLTPRQRADIVHVVLAAAADLGLKVNAIASDYSGARISLHLNQETNAYEQGRALFDGMNPTEVNGGSHFPGSPACPPYSTIEGRASICGWDVEIQIFTDFASPPPEPETGPEPEAIDWAAPELVVNGHPIVRNLPDPIVTCPHSDDPMEERQADRGWCPACLNWVRPEPQPAEATR